MCSQKISTKLISLLLAAGLVAIGAAGCSKKQSKSSYDHFSQAQQYYSEGQNRKAIIELKNALQLDSNNGEARYLFAVILNDLGQGNQAEIELRKALSLGVDKAKVDAALGRAFILQQKYQKVLDEIKPSDSLKGEAAAAIYTVRGNALLALGKSAEAKAAFGKAVKEDPEFSGEYLGLARLAVSQNDLQEALRQTEVALAKAPKKPQGWLTKASILKMQGKDADARSVYEHILEIDKRNVDAHLGLASMDLAAGKLDAARTNIDAAHKIEPGNLRIKYAQAVLYFREKKYADARDNLQDVMKGNPDYVPGILLSGAVNYHLGSYEQAHQDLSRFLQQVPNDAYATNLLAATDLYLGQPGEAIKYVSQLLEKKPGDPQALALAGEAYMQTKDYAKATQYLAKASAIAPKNAALRAQLGASRMGSGDVHQAIQDLESAAAMGPGSSKADALLVITYLNKGKYDQALASAQAWEKKQPNNPIVYFLEGGSYAGKNDFANARKRFEKAVEVKSDYLPAVLNLAQLDLKEKHPQAARKRLEEFLHVDKNNMQAMVALADIAAIQNQGKEYVRWLEQAAEAQPDAILPRAKLADYYLANNDKAKAMQIAHKMVNTHPDSPAALDLLGAAQVAAKEIDGAIATYNKLVEMAPNVPIAYMRLALAQLAGKKVADARVSLKKALELKPDLVQALDALVRLDLLQKRDEDALKLTRELQAHQPKSPVGYDREADILVLQKKYAQAAKVYEQALSRGGGSSVLIKLHNALTRAGDGKAADQRLTSWIKSNPDDVMARDYAAGYYMAKNRDHDAINQYEHLVKLAPQNAAYLNNLANLYQRAGDDRALATAERALKLAPANPSIQDTVGWMLVQQDKPERALKILREATSRAPKAAGIHYHLAVALARTGHKAEAKKELQTLVNAGQNFPELDAAKRLLKGL